MGVVVIVVREGRLGLVKCVTVFPLLSGSAVCVHLCPFSLEQASPSIPPQCAGSSIFLRCSPPPFLSLSALLSPPPFPRSCSTAPCTACLHPIAAAALYTITMTVAHWASGPPVPPAVRSWVALSWAGSWPATRRFVYVCVWGEGGGGGAHPEPRWQAKALEHSHGVLASWRPGRLKAPVRRQSAHVCVCGPRTRSGRGQGVGEEGGGGGGGGFLQGAWLCALHMRRHTKIAHGEPHAYALGSGREERNARQAHTDTHLSTRLAPGPVHWVSCSWNGTGPGGGIEQTMATRLAHCCFGAI